ncbi:hypothetical protein [Alicyclobacillus fodiniaquatilis]|uniref:Uncharacterized protein n=1 Tax=Alicyclobacillus fodiniaquatilis TaxID=1661150 RepID=A0ABW4JP45_9BACL
MKTYDFRAFINGQLVPIKKRRPLFSVFQYSSPTFIVFTMDPAIQNAVFAVTST